MKTRNGFVMSGQSLVEYALMIAIISVASVLVLTLLGVNLGDTYCSVIAGLNGNNCDCENNTCETIAETTDSEPEERKCRYTFDDPATFDDWVQIGAPQSLSIENGSAIFTGTGRGGPRFYITDCTTQFDTSDLIIDLKSVSIKRARGPHLVAISILFRRQDSKNGYYFVYYPAPHNGVGLIKKINNKIIQLDWARAPANWNGKENNFQIRVEGDRLTAFRNGELIVEATDNTFSRGTFGF